MQMSKGADELGREDAQTFIQNERIDYKPFVAVSDMYLVRKSRPVTLEALQDTINTIDEHLWQDIAEQAAHRARAGGPGFDHDRYAEGFAAGVAAVWETIKDDVLSQSRYTGEE